MFFGDTVQIPIVIGAWRAWVVGAPGGRTSSLPA